ncbi:uncharacterized protein LOC123518035 [Portunus trituberculatus]|uniref:uncharacterized protein LOC123518035 n=1 Tax=Portunus trituberculatus TaxID=210409 RepID=UPI001E1D13E8|nr:uncharacterized protein LOC123518035 [Portunus trituberculatus]
MEQASLGRQSGGGARPATNLAQASLHCATAHYQLRGGACVSLSSEDDADRGGVWFGTGPATTGGKTKPACPNTLNLRQETGRRKLSAPSMEELDPASHQLCPGNTRRYPGREDRADCLASSNLTNTCCGVIQGGRTGQDCLATSNLT